MKKPIKNSWLLILMIISQIMLTGLLVQWLKGQWQNEKESFQKDINLKFTQSVDQVMDSMLVKHLITPVLKDSSISTDHLLKFTQRVPPGNKEEHRITAFINDTNGPKQTMITIAMPDSGRGISKQDVAFNTYDSNEKKILLRSVKLIIRHTGGDSAGNWRQFNHLISNVPDTILLKRLFEDKLGNTITKNNIVWISDSQKNKSDIKSPVMFFKTNLFEKPMHVEILRYQNVILKSISAQVIFALTLLIITAAAFILAYRSLKKQETLNVMRNDFVSNITHELKTPVSTVTVALDALKNFDRINDPAKSMEYLDIAFSEMKRLDQLISQVLNTSMLEEHNQYLKTEPVDLNSLINEVLNSMQLRFEQAGALVEFIPNPESVILMIDKLHIHGVIINLLDNTLKYSFNKPLIRLSISRESDSVVLKISDNGEGIPKEYLSRVFDKFFRVPKGNIHDIKGYGLGLSYAKLVMEQHSGSISVRNKNEGGCEFTLIFPPLQA
jgi:signal transduction histidine kinase